MITVSILCGGKSSRMQTEKGLVLYKGKPFINHIIDAVFPITNSIQLITNGNDYDYLNYKIVNDIVLDRGPLGGIYSAMQSTETEINLILSCDIPLMSTEILLELIGKHNEIFQISVFKVEDRIHPLIGIYSKKIIPILKQSIDENQLKVIDFFSKTALQIIPVSSNKSEKFKNINSVIELNEINNNKN